MKFIEYVVDETLETEELLLVINHCEDVMEQRNKDWLKASQVRNKALEVLSKKYNG